MTRKHLASALEELCDTNMHRNLPIVLTEDEGQTHTALLTDEAIDDIVKAEAEFESEQTDDLINVAEALESLRTCLKDRGSNNPVSRSVAAALEEAFTPLFARAEQKSPLKMEMFQGKAACRQATKLSLEDASEQIRITINKIIRWIKRMIEVVFDQIEGIVRGANATARRCEELQDAASRIKADKGDGEIQEGQIKDKGLRSVFTEAHGETFTAHDIEERYQQMVRDFNETLSIKTATEGPRYLGSQIHKILNRNRTGNFTEQAALQLCDETVQHLIKTNFPQFKQEGEDKLVYQAPFGGFEFVLSLQAKGDYFSGMSLVTRVSKLSKQESLPVLRPSEVLRLAQVVEASMHRGMYRDYKKIKSELYHLKTAISDMCDEVSREQRDTYSGEIPSLHFLKTISETMFSIVKKAYAYNGSVSRAILAYGELSLKQYEKAEAQ